MGKRDDLFYGYNKMRDEAYRNHKLENSPLEGKYKSEITVKESVVEILIDHTWVEVFEDNFPYVENCIKELRSFLRHDEELINVQLANNIDMQGTLTYMTEHTDIIEKYDEVAHEVTPSKLLNIFNESTYDIYENRFIYTLVNMCDEFFRELMNAIDRNLGKHYYSITVSHTRSEVGDDGRNSADDDQTKHNITFDKTSKEIEEDEKNLPDLGAVKKLSNMLKDWYDTELMRALKGVKEVTSPLTMTNVLQKNPNFQKAVVLYDFITNYASEKFKIRHTEKDVKLNSKMQQKFLEMANYNDMIHRYNLDKTYAKKLDDNYAARLKEEADEEKRLKKQQEEDCVSRIKIAVETQAEKDKIIKDEMEKKYKKAISIYQAVATKDVNDAVAEFNRRSDIELEDRLEFENELRNKYIRDIETLKQSFDVEYEAFRHEMQIEKNTFIINQTKQLRVYDEAHKKEIDKLNTVHAAEIERAHMEGSKSKQELIKAHKLEMSSKEKEHEAIVESIISEYNQKIEDIKRECDNKITDISGEYKLEKAALIHDYETQQKVSIASYEDRLRTLAARNKIDMERAEKQKENALEDLQKQFEADKIVLVKDAIQKANEEKQTLESRIKTLEAETKITLDKERTEHENSLKKLIAEHDVEISTIKRDADRQIREAVIASENVALESSRTRQDYEQKLSELTTKYDQLSSERDSKNTEEIIMLNRQYKRDLDTTIDTYEKQIASLQQLVSKYKDDLASIRKKQQKEISDVKEEYEKIITRQQNDYNDTIARNESNFNLSYSKLNQQLQIQIEQHNKELIVLENLYNEENDKNNELVRKINELQAKLNAKPVETKVETKKEEPKAEAKKDFKPVEIKVETKKVINSIEEKNIEPKVEARVETKSVETPKQETKKIINSVENKNTEAKVEVKLQTKPVETPKVEVKKEEPKDEVKRVETKQESNKIETPKVISKVAEVKKVEVKIEPKSVEEKPQIALTAVSVEPTKVSRNSIQNENTTNRPIVVELDTKKKRK